MKKLKLLLAAAILWFGGGNSASAYSTSDLTNAGWTQVTASTITGIDDNYYMLVDCNSSDYVMANQADHFRPCYKTIADPIANPSFVWILEGSNNEFNLKSYSTGAYFKQASGWNTSVGYARDSRTKVTGVFVLSDGKYTLKCKESGNYVGHWNDNGAAVANDGEDIAANKAIGNAPGFYLYSISRATFDAALAASRLTSVSTATKASPVSVTSYIQNADWSGDWGGWESTFTSSGNMQWGKQTLESWNASNVIIKQELRGVPNGSYKLTADLISGNNDNKVAYVFATGDTKVSSDAVSAVASADNYTTMSNEVAGKTLTADNVVVTGNTITVGIDQSAGWIVADNFTLSYYGPNLATSEALPDGDMIAGKWYYFDVTIAGKYNLACTTLADIVYTTDGSILVEDAASITTTFVSNTPELTVGRYYVKSTSAQELALSAASYSYNVGSATSSIDGSYLQTLTTASFVFATAASNDPNATFAILDNTAVASLKKAGSEVATGTLSLDGTTLTVTFSGVTLDMASTYTIEVPAGVVGYAGKDENSIVTTSFYTPAVYDGTYYLYNPETSRFLARGNSWGTAAVADYYGVPFTLTVDNKGFATMVFLDNKQGLFNGGGTDVWCWTDNAAGIYEFVAVQDGYNIKTKGGAADKYIHVSATDDYRVGHQGDATLWQLKTPAERNAVLAAYTTDNYQNIITAASLSTTTDEFETYLTTNYAGKDYTDKVGTAKITNAAGDWTWTGVRNQDGQPKYNNAAEAWNATGSWSQTIENLPEGIYRVKINAFERRMNNADSYALGEAGYGNVTSSYLKANDEQVRLKSWYEEVVKNGDSYNPNNMDQAVAAFNNDKYKSEVYTYVGSDGKLTLTIAKPNYIWDCWLLWNNVTLTYFNDQVDATEVAALLETAAEYLEKPMLAELKQAISEAKVALETTSNIANFNALQTAIENSQTSVDSYAAMKANYLDPLAAVLENTNVYTTTAYNSVYGDYLTAYNNGTIANADANALKWNNGDKGTRPVDNLLMPSWTIGGQATGNQFYQNTWSTEGNSDGSNFKNPFFEYWTGNSNVLTATTLQATQTDLVPDGLYKVSAWVRVRQSDAGDKIENAVTMQVGEGTAIDVSAGNQIGDTKFYIKEYTATGKADANGTLTINFTVADGSNVNWLSFKNVKYEAINADITNLIAAINEATELSNSLEEDDIKNSLDEAIADAQEVADSPQDQDQVDDAIAALRTAIDTAKKAQELAISKAAYEVALAAAQAIENGSIPTSAYNDLQDAIQNNTLQDGTAAEYDAATEALNEATAIATPFIAPYAAWKKAKAPVDAISKVEYTEVEAGAHAALEASLSEDGFTTVEAINTAISALPEAVKTYIAKAEPKNEGESFDITCLMANPDFDNNDTEGWTKTYSSGGNAQTSWSCNEFWNNTFDFYQNLTDLPNGSYQLSVQAFSRPGGNDVAYANYKNGINSVHAELYVNKDASIVGNIYDYKGNTEGAKVTTGNFVDYKCEPDEGDPYWVPNGMEGASYYFAGPEVYKTTVAALVTDGNLKLGFRDQELTPAQWTIFDNFHLYYYGSSKMIYFKQQWPQMVAEAEKDLNNALYKNVGGKEKADFESALNAQPQSETEEGYQAVIDQLYEAQTAYRAAYPGYDRLAAVITTATAIEDDNTVSSAQNAMNDTQTTAETALSTANGLFSYMLENEIDNAENNVIGFEKDEYAPYNNIAATTALATANAIENVVEATTENLHAAITGLHAVQWVANEGKMNAVYNGDFALCENDGAMTGWVTDHEAGLGGATHARAFVLESGDNYNNLAAFGQGDGTRSCAFLRFDGTFSAKTTTYTYGTTNGYTMPLTNSWYKFSAQLGGWGQVDKDITLRILNENDVEVAKKTVHTPNTGINNGGDAIDVNLVFNLADADNYKLQIFNGSTSADNAIVISNIELFSITAEEAQMLEKLVELEDLITEATQLSNSLKAGDIKTSLDAAIATAQGVKDAPESLYQVESAITDLQTAINTAKLADAQEKAIAQIAAARDYDLPVIAETLYTDEKSAIIADINNAATIEAVAEQQDLFETLIDTAEAIETSYKQYKEDVAIVKAMIASDAIDYGKEVNSQAKQTLEGNLDNWEDVIQHATGYDDVDNLEYYEVIADKFWRRPIEDGAIPFIGAVVVTKDKQLDITDVLLVNPDVTDFWEGDNNGGYNGDPNDHRAWNVQPEGWYNEQNGGNFQVMTNSAMDANGEVFMEYWSGTAASSGFVLCQKVNLPEGTYKMTGRVGVQQYDGNGETTNVTFSANDIDGTQIPYGPLVDGEIEFVQQQQGEVKIGLKAHEGNNARWMGINKIKLYKTTPKPFAIAENEDYDATQSGAGDVELTRTIKANVWNTIVLPFSLTYDELKDAFGDDVQVAQFSEVVNPNDATSSTIYFNTMETPALQANVPVLLKTSTAGTEYSFAGRTIVPVNGEAKAAGAGNFDFVGNYESQITIAAGNYFISANKLYSSTGNSKLAGTRAYIKAREDAQGARITGFSIDGVETTAIDGIFFEGNTGDKLYNLNGQQIEKGKRGIYIKNGKKVVIR